MKALMGNRVNQVFIHVVLKSYLLLRHLSMVGSDYHCLDDDQKILFSI